LRSSLEVEYKFMTTKLFFKSYKGFTLIETLVALLIFGIAVAIMIPLFYEQRLKNNTSQIRTEAVAFSQEILDGLRQQDVANLPATGSQTRTKAVMGENYTATITYCEVPANCSDSSRQIKLQINRYGTIVYEMQTVFTRLQ